MKADNSDSQKVQYTNTRTTKSDPFFTNVFHQTIDAIIITDLKGIIIKANPALAKLFNTEPDFFIGKNINNLSYEHRIITPKNIKNLRDSVNNGKLIQEAIFISKDGFFKGAMRITMLKSENGTEQLFIVIQDISAESSLKAQLNASKEQLQNILDFVSSMILVTNGTGVRNCNKSFLKFFGTETIEEFSAKIQSISDFFIPLDGYLSEKKKGQWLKAVLRNKVAGIDSKAVMKEQSTGSIRFFLVDSQPFPGEKHYYTVSFTDITELENQKKNLENTKISLEEKVSDRNRELFESYRKLAANEEMLSVIFDIVSAGIMMLDEKGRYVRINNKFCKMYETSENLLLGKDFSILLDESMVEDMWIIFNRLKEGMIKEFNQERRVITKDGKSVDVIINAQWVTMYDGKRYLVCTHHDVSQKNKLEEKHREQERMLVQQSKMAAMGEMIGAIAHQWKQPLNTIALIAQNLKDDFDCDELTEAGINEHIKEVLSQVNFMAATIDDFRNFFKPSREKIVFNVSSAISEIVNLMLPQLKVNYIAVYLDNSGARKYGANVEGYPNEFKQVALNLITNSKEAITSRREQKTLKNTDAGTISIKTESNESHVKITFSDNGGGIPKDIMPKMFEPYFSTKETGTGIGLYMCKTIIESKMKGKISVKNLEEGVEFSILLEKSVKNGVIGEKLAGS